jgi:WS/DGAT/MGAT family acyltransferase
MLGRGLLGLPRQPLRALRSLPTALAALPAFPGQALMPGAPQLQRILAEVQRNLGGSKDAGLVEVRASRAPKTRFNAKITPHRRFSFGSLALDDIKAIKDQLGIKVNDVVVALCASAVREWLLERGELPEEPLVALVPMSVRTEEERGTFGNKVTGMILPIPTNVEDPRERLMRAHSILKRAKVQTQGMPASLMTDVSNFLPPAIFSRASRVALEVTGRIRPALNLVVSNVPGPPVPLYCAGAKMVAHYPVSVITDGVGLNITVMSYQDKIDFGIVIDRDMVDDAWTFAESMSSALEDLKKAVLPPKRSPQREKSPA